MKAKRIFILIFVSLLLVGSNIITGLYDEVRESAYKVENLNYNVGDDILEYAYASVVDNIEDFKILEFNEEVDLGIQREIENQYRRSAINYYRYLDSDPNFAYCLVNTSDDTRICKNEEKIVDNNEYYFYGELLFENSRIRQVVGDIDNGLVNEMNNYHSSINNHYLNSLLADYDVDINDVKINTPSGFKFIYSVDKTFNAQSHISSYLANYRYTEVFAMGCMMFSAILVGLFMLIYPIKYVKEANPFKFVSNIKFEILSVILGLITFAYTFFTIEVTYISISGYLLEAIHDLGITSWAELAIGALNILMWIIWLILISIIAYCVKYYIMRIMNNFKGFILEDTLVGSIYLWLKKQYNKLILIDFSDKTKRNIILFMILNLFIIAIIMVLVFGLGIIGIIFLIIYVVLLAYFIIRQYTLIDNDYQKLLLSTKKVANGNFENIMNEDVGIFNAMREELNNIKDGFEKAVKEETISQSMKTELITNVSHDLKTPLTGIRNYVELLNDDNLDEEKRKEYLNLLDSYTDRLGNLIEDLFEVSKVNSGNVELDLVELDIVSLIKQAISEKEDDLNNNNLEIIFNSNEEKIDISLDSDKTYRVIDNLLTNINKYAMPHTRIYIDIEKKEEDVEIIFKNVSKSRMNFTSDEIVERFVRGDKSRSEAGSGIGLAIVQSFLEAQGAKFKIDIDGDLFKAIINFKLSK